MKQRLVPLTLGIAWATALCTGERADSLESASAAPPVAVQTESAAPSIKPQLADSRSAELVQAAENILGFLAGQVEFERIRIADTVTVYLSPEGGGKRAAMPRERLRQPGNWRVPAEEVGTTYSFVPPPGMTKLTTRVGRHFNCLEYPLASRFPELAHLPHVGMKLEPSNALSCLQSWNLTLVFAAHEVSPTLVAAVYDQWEW